MISTLFKTILTVKFWFIIFMCLALFFSLLIHFNSNPIYSVFSLILAITFSILNLFIMNVEFLSYILFIIYVGAVALLFLFVVMMLNIRSEYVINNFKEIYFLEDKLVFGLIFIKGSFLCWTLTKIMVTPTRTFSNYSISTYYPKCQDIYRSYLDVVDIDMFKLLFIEFWPHFIIITFILLLCLVGALILTMNFLNMNLNYTDFKLNSRLNDVNVPDLNHLVEMNKIFWDTYKDYSTSIDLDLVFFFFLTMAFISFLGITLNRRSIIITLLFSELFLFSVTMNLVMTSVYFAVPEGQVLALLFICMAAAESVLGLGLLVLHFKFYNSTSWNSLSTLSQ